MPRRDWNTPSAHSQNRHHKQMHSAARGRGLDRKLKAAKRHWDMCPHCGTPVTHRRDRRFHGGAGDGGGDGAGVGEGAGGGSR